MAKDNSSKTDANTPKRMDRFKKAVNVGKLLPFKREVNIEEKNPDLSKQPVSNPFIPLAKSTSLPNLNLNKDKGAKSVWGALAKQLETSESPSQNLNDSSTESGNLYYDAQQNNEESETKREIESEQKGLEKSKASNVKNSSGSMNETYYDALQDTAGLTNENDHKNNETNVKNAKSKGASNVQQNINQPVGENVKFPNVSDTSDNISSNRDSKTNQKADSNRSPSFNRNNEIHVKSTSKTADGQAELEVDTAIVTNKFSSKERSNRNFESPVKETFSKNIDSNKAEKDLLTDNRGSLEQKSLQPVPQQNLDNAKQNNKSRHDQYQSNLLSTNFDRDTKKSKQFYDKTPSKLSKDDNFSRTEKQQFSNNMKIDSKGTFFSDKQKNLDGVAGPTAQTVKSKDSQGAAKEDLLDLEKQQMNFSSPTQNKLQSNLDGVAKQTAQTGKSKDSQGASKKDLMNLEKQVNFSSPSQNKLQSNPEMQTSHGFENPPDQKSIESEPAMSTTKLNLQPRFSQFKTNADDIAPEYTSKEFSSKLDEESQKEFRTEMEFQFNTKTEPQSDDREPSPKSTIEQEAEPHKSDNLDIEDSKELSEKLDISADYQTTSAKAESMFDSSLPDEKLFSNVKEPAKQRIDHPPLSHLQRVSTRAIHDQSDTQTVYTYDNGGFECLEVFVESYRSLQITRGPKSRQYASSGSTGPKSKKFGSFVTFLEANGSCFMTVRNSGLRNETVSVYKDNVLIGKVERLETS